MRVLLVVACLWLVAVPVAGWPQLAGSEGRSGYVDVPGGHLDVVWTGPLFNGSRDFGSYGINPVVVSSPHGILVVTTGSDGCSLTHVTGALWSPEIRSEPLAGCTQAHLAAYDGRNDRLLLCNQWAAGVDEPALLAYDLPSRELAWSWMPEVDLRDGRPVSPDAGLGHRWTCNGVAVDLDDGLAYAPYWSFRHRDGVGTLFTPGDMDNGLAAVALVDGTTLWSRLLTTEIFYASMAGIPALQSALAPSSTTFIPLTVTVLDTGLIVTGQVTCACGRTSFPNVIQYAAQWLTLEGFPVGGQVAEDDPTPILEGQDPRDMVPGGSTVAAASGTLALHALGGRTYLINPEVQQPIRSAAIETLEPLSSWINRRAIVWTPDAAAVPLVHALTAIDPFTLEQRWAWIESTRHVLADLHATAAGDIRVMVANVTARAGENEALLVRLDAADGSPLQRILLPFDPVNDNGGWPARMAPLTEGVVVVAGDGNATLLSTRSAPGFSPVLGLDETHPAISEEVVLTAAPGPREAPVVGWDVDWGDGSRESFDTAAASLRHAFVGSGPFQVLVTARYADGLTGSNTTTVYAGIEPPATLTLLQRAFAPENQDMTWGIIGLVVVLLGGLFSLGRRARAQRMLHRHLDRLDAIGDPGRPTSGVEALAALAAERRRNRTLVTKGRLSEAQYMVLHRETASILTGLRQRLLGGLSRPASEAFRHQLDLAFSDQRISQEEHTALLATLELEPLSDPDKQRVRSWLDAWQRGTEA